MKYIRKAGAAVLAAALACSLAACSDTTWVFDYDGEKLSSGMYIAISMNAYSTATSQPDLNPEISDLMKQTIEGKPAKDWIVDQTQTYANRYMATERKFDELGLVIDEDMKSALERTSNNNWNSPVAWFSETTLGQTYTANGVSLATYQKLLTNSEKNTMLFNKYYDKGGLEEVPEAELTTFFHENFVKFNSFNLSPKTGDELTDEDKAKNAALKSKADEYAKMINDGKSFNEAQDAYLHYANSTEHAADEALKTDQESAGWQRKTATSPSEAYVKTLFSQAADGKAYVIADGDKYYVVVKYDFSKSAEDLTDMRSTVLNDMRGDAFNAMIDKWASTLQPTVNTAAVSRYDPKNIKL